MNKEIKTTIIFILTMLSIYLVFLISDMLEVYKKYKPIEDVLVELSAREYSDEYNCIQFSQDAVKMLAEKNIKAIEITGTDNEEILHRWISIEIEPQHKKILKPDEYKSLSLSQNYE